MFFVKYLRRELQRRMRQAIVIATGLALGVGLVVVVTAMSSGVGDAQAKVLGALYGVGTDITVTAKVQPGSGQPGEGGPTPEPYVQHIENLSSPTLGTMAASSVAGITRLDGVASAGAGLILTDIISTLPADNAPPPPTLTPPTLTSVVGVDVTHGAFGELAAARLSAGKGFTRAQGDADVAVLDSGYAASHHLAVGASVVIQHAKLRVIGIVRQDQGGSPPQIYIPLARAQALAGLTGQINTIYVQASSAASVGRVSDEISKLMPDATVTNSASLASGIAGSLATTAKLARTLGTWLAVLALIAAFAVASLLTLAAVGRRVREFGTLKALGWRTSRITGQITGELAAMGVAGAAMGVAVGLGGTLIASALAPKLTATVQNTNTGSGGFGGSLGANGGVFQGQVGGPVTTIANPNATHTVSVPFSAPVTVTAIVLAVVLAIAGALIAGALGSWQAGRLRPAEAFARIA